MATPSTRAQALSLPHLPYLLPEVPLVWRAPGTLQVGIDPVNARQFPGVGAREFRALRRLDGTRSLTRVVADFDNDGGSSPWLAAAIGVLVATGAVIDHALLAPRELPAPEMARLGPDIATGSLARPGSSTFARRRQAFVHVFGTGRVGVGIASLLSAAGVGFIRVTPTSGDQPRVSPRTMAPLGPALSSLGMAAREAARDAMGRSTWTLTRSTPSPRRPPDLVVLSPPRVVAPSTAERWATSGTPHLAALADGPSARVGPLVLPGHTPCLRCLDLHRTDRDPHWPIVLTQVAHQRGPHITADDTVLSTLTAATAATHALALIVDPRGPWPPSAGALLELRLPELRWSRRSWSVHPDCGCQWNPEPFPRAA